MMASADAEDDPVQHHADERDRGAEGHQHRQVGRAGRWIGSPAGGTWSLGSAISRRTPTTHAAANTASAMTLAMRAVRRFRRASLRSTTTVFYQTGRMPTRMASVLGIDVGGTKVAVARVEGARAEGKVEAGHRPRARRRAAGRHRGSGRPGGGRRRRPGGDRRGRARRRWSSPPGTALASVNIPLEGVPLREELGKRFGVPGVRGQRRQLRRAGRGPAGARPAGPAPGDADAGHRRGRRRDHRRPDLARPHRPGRRAGPRDRGRPDGAGRIGRRLPAARLAGVALQRPRPGAGHHRGRADGRGGPAGAQARRRRPRLGPRGGGRRAGGRRARRWRCSPASRAGWAWASPASSTPSSPSAWCWAGASRAPPTCSWTARRRRPSATRCRRCGSASRSTWPAAARTPA